MKYNTRNEFHDKVVVVVVGAHIKYIYSTFNIKTIIIKKTTTTTTTKANAAYRTCRKNEWLEEICGHMEVVVIVVVIVVILLYYYNSYYFYYIS